MRRFFLLLAGFGLGFGMLLLVQKPKEHIPKENAPDLCLEQVKKVDSLEPMDVRFPYSIPGTELIAQNLVSYEGPFLENDSQQEVVDIAALVLYNAGEQTVDEVQVVLKREKDSFTFHATCIPPESSVMVLEQDGKRCIFPSFSDCTGTLSSKKIEWMGQGSVGIQPRSMGSVSVTNHMEKPIERFVLYYKPYLEESEMYLGGKSYTCPVGSMEPGQTTEVVLHHYAQGYSQIIGAARE